MSLPRGMGALESPRDYRDRYVSMAVTEAAPEVILPDSYLVNIPGSVFDQNQTPSCVSHAWAITMRLWWYRKTGELVEFSPRFLDVLAKRFDGLGEGTDRLTMGTYPRLVAKLAVQYGCATTKTVPNDTLISTAKYRDDEVLTDEALKEAEKYKIPGYVSIGTDRGSLRLATYLYGAVSTLMRIGNEWWVPSYAPQDIDPLRTPAIVVSGHQIVVNGWHGTDFENLRNSWGYIWDRKGDASFNAARWAPWILESWAIAQIPTNAKDFLKRLPAPSAFHYNFTKNLSRGDSNEEVKFAQIALMISGYLDPVPEEQLGFYGPRTARAAYAFQVAHGVRNPSGDNIGPLTRAQLNSLFLT